MTLLDINWLCIINSVGLGTHVDNYLFISYLVYINNGNISEIKFHLSQ